MLKSITFAALTLLATLTAVQAALKSAVPDLAEAEITLRSASVQKAKMPPRKTIAAQDGAIGTEQIQFD